MHKILVIGVYFPLYALHVSDYISLSSGATFISCTSHLVYAGTIRVAVVWLRKMMHGVYNIKKNKFFNLSCQTKACLVYLKYITKI